MDRERGVGRAGRVAIERHWPASGACPFPSTANLSHSANGAWARRAGHAACGAAGGEVRQAGWHPDDQECPMIGHLLTPEPVMSLDAYLATDHGGRGVQAIRELGGPAVIDLITKSGLRGRGGGGFPTGMKWSSIASQDGGRRFLVANGAE